jgi:antitoxin component HigA of HigAB toxin-antitoxin module
MQPIKPIRNEADYELALKDIDDCLDAAACSPERERLEVLRPPMASASGRPPETALV